jgi:hypothetical protein
VPQFSPDNLRRVNGEQSYAVHFLASDAIGGNDLLRSCRTSIVVQTKLSKFGVVAMPDEAEG